ncbi:hypothetical protein AAFF_G00257330 [Aldrovandia affinis]|uniref:Hexosyltransferase n=1 Tax=Aldrovandia affinis TaxID=143900 RepID=A0AAD7ST69_9TELE|nr:hypothetical protein AAFF_G00257330 [Aldrovandia affinis]
MESWVLLVQEFHRYMFKFKFQKKDDPVPNVQTGNVPIHARKPFSERSSPQSPCGRDGAGIGGRLPAAGDKDLSLELRPPRGAEEDVGRRAAAGRGVDPSGVHLGHRGAGFEKKKLNKLLRLENREHGDILQWDFNDSFFNLTLKQILFLEWMQKSCPQAASS